MQDIRTTNIRMIPRQGYGDNDRRTEQLDLALRHDSEIGKIVALRIPFAQFGNTAEYNDLCGVAIAHGRAIARSLHHLDSETRDRLAGLFLTYSGACAEYVSKAIDGTANTACLLMSHGIVILPKSFVLGSISNDHCREYLTCSAVAILGRNASNHDRMVLSAEAETLINAIATSVGYAPLDIRFTYDTEG
jgi:hypothetical protein